MHRFITSLSLLTVCLTASFAQTNQINTVNYQEFPNYRKSGVEYRYLPNSKVPFHLEQNDGYQFETIDDTKNRYCQTLILFVPHEHTQKRMDEIIKYRDAKDTKSQEFAYELRDRFEVEIGHPATEFYTGRDLIETGEPAKILQGVSYVEAAAMKNFIPAQVLLGKLLAESRAVKLELTRITKESQDGVDRRGRGPEPTEEDKEGPQWETFLPENNPLDANLDEAYMLLRYSIGRTDPSIETDAYIIAIQRVLGEVKIAELEANLKKLSTRPYTNFDTAVSYYFVN